MSRPGMPPSLTLRQTASVCGVSYNTARRLWWKRELPGTLNPLTGYVVVKRTDLIPWLIKKGYPPEVYRVRLQPRAGHLFAVGFSRAAERNELRGCGPTFVPSVLSLGMRLASEPCWGVMFNFRGLGRDRAIEAAGELREMKDCPMLVGVASEDEAGRPGDPTRIFDQTYTEPIDFRRLAEAMRRLYRGIQRAWPRVADPEAGSFKQVGERV